MVYDIAIIGGGPAGASSAVNAKILNKNFIWFSCGSSKKVERAELVKNYLGLPDITGAELASAFEKHINALGITPKNALVTGVYQQKGGFLLIAGTEEYTAKTVILCTGVQTQKPIDGEENFLGRGVSYCATCDGLLYKGKTIAVLCYDKTFEHEIDYLCGIAQKVYVMPMYKGYEVKNAEVILKQPVSFTGDMRLKQVVFKDGALDIDGAFILRSSVSPAVLVHGLNVDGGHIIVNRRQETNIAGVFASGDCTGRPYQYIKSAGEGNVAVHSAVEYLAQKE